MAQTYTRTIAVPRLSLIKVQVIVALRLGGGVSEDNLARVRQGLDERLVNRVTIAGIGGDGLCYAQLRLNINWATHTLEVNAGHSLVDIGQQWKNQVAPPLDEMITEFTEFCQSCNLHRKFLVDWVPGTDVNINSRLGFTNAKHPQWGGDTSGLEYTMKELNEVTYSLRMVDLPDDHKER